MKASVSVKFVSSKNCLGSTVSSLLQDLKANNPEEIVIVRVASHKATGYISLIGGRENNGKDQLRLNGLYATKLGLNDNDSVVLEALNRVPPCTSVWIEPLTVDDWEILELHADQLEMQILDQIRVVWPGQIFPLWVDGNVCIYLRTVKLEPGSECGVLIPLTELIVEPKVARNTTVPNIVQDNNSSNDTSLVPSSLQDETKVPIDNEDYEIGGRRRVSVFYSVFYLKFVKRIFDFVTFLMLFVWKQVPATFSRVRSLLFPSLKNSLSAAEPSDSQRDSICKHIQSVPDDLDLVLRVEPVVPNHTDMATPFLLDQPSTVYLQSNSNTWNEKANVFMVLMSKVLSPLEKEVGSSTTKKSSSVRSDSVEGIKKTKIDLSKTSVMGNSDASISKSLKKCVVRMYIHSKSKFAMRCDWNELCSNHLKLSSSLRRQMNLCVSSKVRIQKLTGIPRPCSDVKTVSLDIILAIPSLSSSVNFTHIAKSFEKWIASISDVDNPVPITTGTLLVFPVLVDNEILDLDSEPSCVVEVIVTEIQSKDEKGLSGDSIKNTYLISSDDICNIEVHFTQSNRSNAVALPSEVDIQLPLETALVYCRGLEFEFNSLVQFVELGLASRPLSAALTRSGSGLRPLCVLVSGPKGTGKTALCHSVLHQFGSDASLHAYVRTISCGKWRGKKPENVKRHCDTLLHELLWRQPSVLLLDDLDQLLPASSAADEDKTPDSLYTLQLISVIKGFLQTLCGQTQYGWENGHRVSIILTCKSKNSLHPCLSGAGSHLYNKTIQIELPNTSKRQVILKSIVENFTDYSCPEQMEEVVDKTEGFATSDILALIRRSCHLVQQKHMLKRQNGTSHAADAILSSGDIAEALTGFTPASLQNAKLHKPTPLTWKQVGGLADVRQKLTEQLVWPMKYRHLFTECGLQAQSGVLLFGPPGCGKTLVAGVVANECGLNFISIKGPEVLNKYIGASEAAVRDLFSRAKAAAPCVLFFDEFDSLAPQRGHDSTGVTDRVVNQLLTHLDGVEPLVGVTVMAASSRPDLLDPALLRPGRLDSLLYCPLPSVQERHEILISLSENLPLHREIDLEQLAAACENFSGADLKALLYNAQLEAVHETIDSFSKPANKNLSIVKHYSTPTTSISPISSCSTLSSTVNMEVDDLYQMNDFSAMEQYEQQDNPPNVSSGFVDDLTHVAADLIRSVQELNYKQDMGNAKGSYNHGGYQICFADGSSGNENNMASSNTDSQQKIQASDLLYFPSMHHGRSKTVPEDVAVLTEVVCHSFDSKNVVIEPTASVKAPTTMVIKNSHIKIALEATRPSLSGKERVQLEQLYSSFVRSRERVDASNKDYYKGKPRATLS